MKSSTLNNTLAAAALILITLTVHAIEEEPLCPTGMEPEPECVDKTDCKGEE